ncbi:zinc-ribbon and DUF3426 domain-containing protein [Marinomonas algarum]|uniref:Zinc-ribbon domain-containing protein n=1 Tax=Marinomonas algarum TaxID=2883105 RepID=A0A9X1IL96_9GAMM|nr:DUF3426 domain-containing protein [Marinomonas algarum]MCB5161328.1 zinc-ribbon domain-containing protein [Marinomonas algarum]
MANSIITRCPKCSTAFRVSDEVLNMAKGKVRCGQCFHIFDAGKPSRPNTPSTTKKTKTTPAPNALEKPVNDPIKPNTPPVDEPPLSPASEVVNPDWLDTLFDDDDLQPQPKTQNTPSLDPADRKKPADNTGIKPNADTGKKTSELAPWELELAEVEAALSEATASPLKATTTVNTSSVPATPTSQKAKTKAQITQSTNKALNNSSFDKEQPETSPELASALASASKPVKATPVQEPDYMTALHSLAQSAAENTQPSDLTHQHTALEQLSAQQSLAPLLEDETDASAHSSRTWPWLIATFLGLMVFAVQVGAHYFDEGSRSATFRPIYQSFCSYTGCTLPRFEDMSAMSIQHVRIQSHPSIPNALLVNAIITNTSNFSQAMPKIALEFFDLNGLPVAARLFSPNNYLHKDFLDITYMPPNTPIHLVIPIQDPAARAVTHQLIAFPADTRSY